MNEALTHYDMDDPWKHYAQWEKPVTKGHLSFHLHELSRIGNLIETESR